MKLEWREEKRREERDTLWWPCPIWDYTREEREWRLLETPESDHYENDTRERINDSWARDIGEETMQHYSAPNGDIWEGTGREIGSLRSLITNESVKKRARGDPLMCPKWWRSTGIPYHSSFQSKHPLISLRFVNSFHLGRAEDNFAWERRVDWVKREKR